MDDNEELAGLLTEAQKGNLQALGALLAQMRPWMRWRAEGQVGRRLVAYRDGSDIVQDVHLRAFERFHQFQGNSVSQLQAWIKIILRNIIADHIRGPKGVEEEERGDRLPDVPADGTTPSQGAMRIEDQARLVEALQWLPEKQRLVVQLRLYDGLPFEEVARRVGVKVGNARVLMVRAIEKLKSVLGDEDE